MLLVKKKISHPQKLIFFYIVSSSTDAKDKQIGFWLRFILFQLIEHPIYIKRKAILKCLFFFESQSSIHSKKKLESNCCEIKMKFW